MDIKFWSIDKKITVPRIYKNIFQSRTNNNKQQQGNRKPKKSFKEIYAERLQSKPKDGED